jgi:hypothetical protein
MYRECSAAAIAVQLIANGPGQHGRYMQDSSSYTTAGSLVI